MIWKLGQEMIAILVKSEISMSKPVNCERQALLHYMYSKKRNFKPTITQQRIKTGSSENLKQNQKIRMNVNNIRSEQTLIEKQKAILN